MRGSSPRAGALVILWACSVSVADSAQRPRAQPRLLCGARHISFIFHDPGARNHLLPLIHRARTTIGRDRIGVWDLRGGNTSASEIVQHAPRRTLFVFGSSMNRAEREAIRAVSLLPPSWRACSVQYIDPPGISTRLDQLDEAETANLYLLSLPEMVPHLERHQTARGRGVVCGSTFVESLFTSAGGQPVREAAVKPAMCPSRGPLVVFFSAPVEPTLALGRGEIVATLRHAAEAVSSATDATGCLVVRMHPRTDALLDRAQVQLAASLSSPAFRVVIDRAETNWRLLRAAALSLSFGSNVAMESIAAGTPHAFVEEGWPASAQFLGKNYAWLGLPVLRGAAEHMATAVRRLLSERQEQLRCDPDNLVSSGGGRAGTAGMEACKAHAKLRMDLAARMTGSGECVWRQLTGGGTSVHASALRSGPERAAVPVEVL